MITRDELLERKADRICVALELRTRLEFLDEWAADIAGEAAVKEWLSERYVKDPEWAAEQWRNPAYRAYKAHLDSHGCGCRGPASPLRDPNCERDHNPSDPYVHNGCGGCPEARRIHAFIPDDLVDPVLA